MKLWKKILFVSLFTLLIALLFGCGSGDGTANGPITSTPRQFGSLQFTLSADKSVYTPGQQATFVFTIKNTSMQVVNAQAPTNQIYQIEVDASEQRLWIVPGGGLDDPTTVIYGPGETKTYTGVWKLENQLNSSPVPAGTYTVRAFLPFNTVDGMSFMNPQTDLAAMPIQITVKSSS